MSIHPIFSSSLLKVLVGAVCVVSAMESHCIHVDKEALKRTSDLLGVRQHFRKTHFCVQLNLCSAGLYIFTVSDIY